MLTVVKSWFNYYKDGTTWERTELKEVENHQLVFLFWLMLMDASQGGCQDFSRKRERTNTTE